MAAGFERRPMEIRQHLSQHAAVADLPLVTRAATVTEVSAMDRSRNDEVVSAIRAALDERGTDEWRATRPAGDGACRRWIRRRLDRLDHTAGGTPLNRYLPPADRAPRANRRLAALQDRYVRPYPSLVRLVVETDTPVEFLPGQYVGVRYGDVSRAYSVASSPSRDEIEFCVRRVPGGRFTSTLASRVSPGDTLTLRGPYGDLLLEDPSRRDVVFLATGTGVAPFKSMIDYTFERGRDVVDGERRDVWLFLGCGWADDLPYREAFRALDNEHPNFHFVPTLSREPYLADWDGETDYVQHALVKYVEEDALDGRALPDAFEPYRDEPPRRSTDARIDPAWAEVYACGINAMVASLVDAVDRLGVPPGHVQFEGFG